MAKQTINIGSAANDGTGSTLREAFDITNDNFTELYDGTGGLFHKIEGTNFTGSLLVGHSTTGTLDNAFYNTGIGISALDALANGDNNVAIGYNAGTALTSGGSNTLIGSGAGDALTTGGNNVAVGYLALSTEDDHGHNVAVGYQSLFAQNAGANAFNVAIGYQAGTVISTGVQNTLIGGLAGDALTTGGANVVMGYSALSTANTTESQNVAIGAYSLNAMDNGSTTNTHNTAIGYYSGVSVSTGRQNTIIGALAGDALTTGINNTVIGYNAAASAVDVNNEITLGDTNIANVRIPADSTLKIGASGDLQLEHLSSNSFIKNTDTGDLYIENQVDDKDVIFRSDDGSGGLATYFYLDGSSALTRVSKNFRADDSVKFQVGSSSDCEWFHNGTDTNFNNETGDLYITNKQDDGDIIFRSDNGSGSFTEYFRLDGSDADGTYTYTRRPDGGVVTFGNEKDLRIWHDPSTNFSYIRNYTNDLSIENTQEDGDIIFKSDDGSGGLATYFYLDGSAGGANPATVFPDDSALYFGTGTDFHFKHNGTNSYIENETGHLYITQDADDSDIIFRADDGSGSLATYFYLDGSLVDGSSVLGATRFPDKSKIYMGTGGDLEIYHDGSNSIIQDLGSGDLRLAGNVVRIRNAADTENMISCVEDGEVSIAYNNATKFQTTSTGVSVTGVVSASNTISAGGAASASAGAKLHVADGTGAGLEVIPQTSNDRVTLLSYDRNASEYQTIDLDGADIHFNISGTEKMRINSSGDILFGTTSETNSHAYFSAESNDRMVLSLGAATTSASTIASFKNSNGAVGSISVDGSATAFNTSSDYRLKEDLKDFDGLDKVSKIPVYDFKWKVDDSRSYGVLAHELQEVVPNAVNGEKDAEEMQGVDYSKIVPLLIKSIQELEARVKTLENK
jgi:hypothetical protein